MYSVHNFSSGEIMLVCILRMTDVIQGKLQEFKVNFQEFHAGANTSSIKSYDLKKRIKEGII